MPSGTSATSGASRTGGFAVPSTNPVMSRPSRYANPTCSAASSATSSTARATARAWSHTLSGALPLIQSQASCGVAGARSPSIPSSPGKSASDAGASDGATSRQAAAPNPATMFTPPADTSGARNRRNEATASVGVTPGRRSNSRKWCASVPCAKIPNCGRVNAMSEA